MKTVDYLIGIADGINPDQFWAWSETTDFEQAKEILARFNNRETFKKPRNFQIAERTTETKIRLI